MVCRAVLCTALDSIVPICHTLPMTNTVKRLRCCVCDGLALAVKQWWNRDKGFGLCGACARKLKAQRDYDAQEFESYYGLEGVHWLPETENA